jgi:predicted kinase
VARHRFFHDGKPDTRALRHVLGAQCLECIKYLAVIPCVYAGPIVADRHAAPVAVCLRTDTDPQSPLAVVVFHGIADEIFQNPAKIDRIRLDRRYIAAQDKLVRAKVNAFRLEDEDADRAGVLKEIESYLTLAGKISTEKRAAIVITMGVSGSGKSWLARRLVEHAGLVRMRSDVERKRLHGLDPEDSSGSNLDADLYSSEATERTYRHLIKLVEPLLHAGIPALVDAACLKRWQRTLFSDLARERNVPFAIVHCKADQTILEQRIKRRAEAGDDPSEAGLEVLAHQQQNMEPLDESEQAQALDLDTAGPDSTRRAADWIENLLDHVGPGSMRGGLGEPLNR